jgi:hypothetical protein
MPGLTEPAVCLAECGFLAAERSHASRTPCGEFSTLICAFPRRFALIAPRAVQPRVMLREVAHLAVPVRLQP